MKKKELKRENQRLQVENQLLQVENQRLQAESQALKSVSKSPWSPYVDPYWLRRPAGPNRRRAVNQLKRLAEAVRAS